MTTDGTPIYNLDSSHKKPYEIILIGKRTSPDLQQSADNGMKSSDLSNTHQNCTNIDRGENSHKYLHGV